MPAKTQFIGKLREDQEVRDAFLVFQKQLTSGRTGKSYLRLTVGDRTGRIETRVWEGAEEIARRFNQGDLVYITGLVTSYQGVLQVKATYIEPIDDISKIDWADFLPSAERPIEEMWAELTALAATIENPHLADLVRSFIDDPENSNALKRAPAALSMHHAYVGGLLEHTLGVMKLANALSALYPVNRDLLMAGAFLHDIGKTRELYFDTAFDYTEEGRLLGHLLIGMEMLKEKIRTLDGFPEEAGLHLAHMIASHHGELEWGSPKRPKTIEALLLHAIDNIDAKICSADKSLKEAEARQSSWTEQLRMFGRPLVRTPDLPENRQPSPAQSERALPAKEPETMAELLEEEFDEEGKQDLDQRAGQGKLF